MQTSYRVHVIEICCALQKNKNEKAYKISLNGPLGRQVLIALEFI